MSLCEPVQLVWCADLANDFYLFAAFVHACVGVHHMCRRCGWMRTKDAGGCERASS